MKNETARREIKSLDYYLQNHTDDYSEESHTAMMMAIKALEQQQDVHDTCIEDYPTCTECEHYDKEKHYCPRFCQVIKDTLAEAQPCEDCISRQKALDCFEQTNTRQGAKYAIETLPSVTPQRPKGKWLHIYKSDIACKCSVCHIQMPITEYYHYCPNCGAEMSGGGEDGKDSAFD